MVQVTYWDTRHAAAYGLAARWMPKNEEKELLVIQCGRKNFKWLHFRRESDGYLWLVNVAKCPHSLASVTDIEKVSASVANTTLKYQKKWDILHLPVVAIASGREEWPTMSDASKRSIDDSMETIFGSHKDVKWCDYPCEPFYRWMIDPTRWQSFKALGLVRLRKNRMMELASDDSIDSSTEFHFLAHVTIDETNIRKVSIGNRVEQKEFKGGYVASFHREGTIPVLGYQTVTTLHTLDESSQNSQSHSLCN